MYGPTPQRLVFGADRFVSKSTLTTPPDIKWMRSVSLRKTLSQPFSFWFGNPRSRSRAAMEQLYKASEQARHFDMFLSHTWLTNGRWKFLSLLLHFGWPTMLTCWGCMIILAFGLCMLGWLPLFGSIEAVVLNFESGPIPSACWIQVFGLLGILLGCILFPYIPFYPFYRPDKCFLDFACIHQTESSKTREGIMSISAFLLGSEELRVLWSEPLLSRLWCIFEIAAYRKLKPEGRIIIAPVNNEFSALLMFLWWQTSCCAFWIVRSREGGGDIMAVLLLLLCVFCALVPASAYSIWRNHKSSEKLKNDLANFDVKNVHCSNDFDRECIHEAIITWYGTLDAFSEYVRGPFTQEVLKLMRASGSVSSHYIILPLSPLICLSLDTFLALCKAGAPARVLMTFFCCHVVSLDLLFMPAVAIFFSWITKRGLWLGKFRCPFVLEICIILAVCIFFSVAGGLVAVILSARNLSMMLGWNGFAVVFAGIVWRCCWRTS